MDVNVTELRQNLPKYIESVRRGKKVRITVRGAVVAQLVPPANEAEKARERLRGLRPNATIGDVVSPLDESWNVD